MRSSFLRLLRSAFWRANAAPFSSKRRIFVQNSLRAGAVATLAPHTLWSTAAGAAMAPSIAIVGAGLGGLTAAWYLHQKGIRTTVHEAGHRPGGRTLTMRNVFGPGLAVDLGGEFVDAWHNDLIGLAAAIEVPLSDLRMTGQPRKEIRFYQGGHRTESDLEAAIRPFVPAFRRDMERIPENISYKNMGECADLDQVSIAGWLRQNGVSGWLYDYFWNAFTLEYGMDAEEQSALNMLTVFHLPEQGQTGIIGGEGSEVLRIQGGAQTLSERLVERLPADTVRYHHPLTALRQSPDGRYQLSFDGLPEIITADRVLLAIPFTKLREVRLEVPLSAPKRQAIAELGYGNSTKLALGFKKRRWNALGYSGDVSSDLPFAQCGWDGSATQAGKAGVWTLFGGGRYSEALLKGDIGAATRQCIEGLNQFFPGIKKRYNGSSQLWPWPSYEWSKAAYSCWKIGQWSAFAGAEGEPEGHVYFAGEHCSVEFQGFMNGAVESGKKAADALAARL